MHFRNKDGIEDKLSKHLIANGGHAMAYSTLQDGLEYFLIDEIGYISFASFKNKQMKFCLSNPICDKSKSEELFESFYNQFQSCVFIQIDEHFAKMLSERGFLVNELGVETTINIKNFNYCGRAKEFLRRNSRKALEKGIVVEEFESLIDIKEKLHGITDSWLEEKCVDDKEIWFLARKAQYEKEKDVRKFVARFEDSVEGFVFFDPIYNGGKISGYYADITRAKADSHPGTIPLIIRNAMDRFKEEGIHTMSLGLSPFFMVEDGKYLSNPIVNSTFRFFYEYGNSIYPFKNLSFTKSRYGGGIEGDSYKDENVELKKVYFAQKSNIPFFEIYDAFRMTGIIDGIIPSLKKIIRNK